MKKYITLGMVSLAVLLLSGCTTQTSQKITSTTAPAETAKVALSTEGGTCTANTDCETGLK